MPNRGVTIWRQAIGDTRREARGLVATESVDASLASALFASAAGFEDVWRSPPSQRRAQVATLFLEPSTRTEGSFRLAAERLGVAVHGVCGPLSSIAKGEALRDTLLTLQALGVHAVVMRHPMAGAAQRASEWLDVPVVNAGDGAHDHPTQALVDAYTLTHHFGSIQGLHVVIVGDILRGRGAHANATLLPKLGARVTVIGPRSLLPVDRSAWSVAYDDDLDAILPACDVVMLQRRQVERPIAGYALSADAYRRRYALTESRLERMPSHAVVMHPGPATPRGEADGVVLASARSLARQQVTNGVAVRMAVLDWVLGNQTDGSPA